MEISAKTLGIRPVIYTLLILFLLLIAELLSSCSSVPANPPAMPPQELPVISVSSKPAAIYSEYTASLQGNRDIEIRPQVDGTLQAITVDEGAYVHKGQTLFRIDERPYREQLNNANAQLLSAKAALESAAINVRKLTPLVQNNVISDVQLQSARAAYDAAKANVAQAEAQVASARINVGYTNITAPADGYIGKIPFKTGSLVSRSTADPLTTLSENRAIHAYFTMSENDFSNFKTKYPGATLQEKIKQLPEVELLLADNSVYPAKGKVELAEGQFDKTDGTISFRATFPNTNGLLRSGNTGKIRISTQVNNTLLVPQEATFELQDKVMVYALGDSDKVYGKPLTIAGTSGKYYLVSGGLKPGEKIVYQGIDRLHDGAVIKPKSLPTDSVFKTAAR